MNDNKIWKDIVGFDLYKVSEDGEVMNKKTGRILRACENSSNYQTVNLYNNGRRRSTSIHRIVAETFNGCDNPSLEVNHRDGNKHNNRPENLEWTTRGDNERHAYKNGLKYGPNHIPVRIVDTGETFGSIKECARAIGGNDCGVKRCLDGLTKTYMGLVFEYAEKTDINASSHNSFSSKYAVKSIKEKKVRIVETGDIFPSISACARAIGGDQGTISACLLGRHKTHKGYHYEYV